jgi:hypothetical protein
VGPPHRPARRPRARVDRNRSALRRHRHLLRASRPPQGPKDHRQRNRRCHHHRRPAVDRRTRRHQAKHPQPIDTNASNTSRTR